MRLFISGSRDYVLRLAVAAAVGVGVSGPLSSSHAADIFYDDSGGNFGVGPSWVGGVAPGAGDVAIFDTGDTKLNIGFAANRTISGMDVLDNVVTFDLNGFTLSLTGNSDLDIGGATGVDSSATFTSGVAGGVLSVRDIDIIGPTSGSAAMVVTGPNTTLIQNSSFRTTVGGSFGGPSSLRIEDQATFNTGTSDFTINPTGTVTVASGAVLNVNDDININGGTMSGLGGNSFNWVAGKTFTVQNGGNASTFSSQYDSPDNSTWIVTGAGSSISGAGNAFDLAGASTALVENGGTWSKFFIVKEGSTFTADGVGTTVAGFDSVDGTVTLQNGAAAGTSSVYHVGDFVSGGGAGFTGTLNVLSGSSLQATFSTGLRVSESNSDSNGVVNIDGSGSSVTTTGTTLGSFSGTTGEINVTNGGSYTSTGITTVNATGTININGGTALLGDYVDNGGTINFVSGTFGHNGNFSIDAGSPVGSTVNTSTRSLIFGGTISINTGSTVNLDGGILSAGSIQNTGTLNYTAGILELTGDDLDVDFGGLLTRTPTVGAGQDIRVTNAVNISAVGLLTMDGGSLTGGTVNNDGIIQMNSLSALIDGGILNNTGSVSGTGLINAQLINHAGAEIRTDAGDLLVFNSSGNTNSGVIDNLAGTVQFNSNLTNDATGVIATKGTLKVLGGLTNHGSLAASAGNSDIFGDVTNSATGLVSVTNGSTANFFGAMDNSGDVFVSADSKAIFLNDVAGPGSFSGGGTVEFANGFSPGASPAIVSFGGDVEVAGGASILIELGGLNAGSEFDQLDIAGDVILDGELELALLGGFTPSPGDTFQIIQSASRTGTFSSVTTPPLGGGLAFDVIYGANGVSIEILGSALAGDLDGDGFVGINDLNIVLGNWNQNVPPANPLADPSGDGFVGIDDLNEVLGNWNAGTPPQEDATVPEPGTLALSLLGGLALARRMRRAS